ncbi:LOW QUALITY PROTEIN: uncharacterized protein LOC114976546 [Acropora millepora]|uniref:LOW QUALITY PROTEIN: uncharacterized protein LOC114976546 n=1 Tax=Acropora millepora TaxID=45264 RepID=UPI001CF2A088|nr:LOW QUALITY PROTEIN: uncharacterized protein LOC114976546 [Acropora millepora]
MSGKEKPRVTRRPNRGRSAHDSKGKTDSGCFVDEELERNGSSDSSQGSASSPPAKETDPKKVKTLENNRKNSSSHTAEPGDDSETAPNSEENVMSELDPNNKNEDIFEKTQNASDFYCLYYSGSAEGTSQTREVSKVKRKPPVPPKLKARRGSAPPSTFNNIDKFCQQNSEVNKRFSYSEYPDKSLESSLENSDNWSERRSVEERVLFFEACAQNGFVDSSVSVKASNLKTSSKIQSDNEDGPCVALNGLHDVHEDHNDLGRSPPLANTEDLSFESRTDYEACNFDTGVDHVAPLVEEEEFAVDGSNLFDSSMPKIQCAVDGSPHTRNVERQCLVCDNDHNNSTEAVNASQSLVITSFSGRVQDYSDHLVNKGLRRSIHENDMQETQGGLESFDPLVSKDDDVRDVALKVNTSSVVTRKPNKYSDDTITHVDNTEDFDFKGNIVNPRINEIKQDLLTGPKQRRGIIRQKRPGSIAGISRSLFEKDLSNELKRRSWSFSEPRSTDISNFLVRECYQSPSTKLNGSPCQVESGLSSFPVHSYHSDRTLQRRSSFQGRERSEWGSLCKPRRGSFDHSGYASDESSVHSEPLFEPLRRRPQINKGNIFKSMSVDSSISVGDNRTTSLDKINGRRFQHSLGNRDPLHALRRQSVEFASDTDQFEPHTHVQLPCLQSLRRSLSSATCSSSSDSEVEKIFSNSEATAPVSSQSVKHAIYGQLTTSPAKRRVSAMEVLFGPQSSRQTSNRVQSSLSSKLCGNNLPSGGISDFSPQLLEDDVLFDELAEENVPGVLEQEAREVIEEPGLEFDDTDYSEFYTRCEDKESLICAEALSIKKLLQSPQTIVPDPDIESVVMAVTERQVLSPAPEGKTTSDSDTAGFRIAEAKDCIKGEQCCQSCRQHRGTQTPPAHVFKAISPPPSVGTQTPPLSLSQELLPPSLLKELQKDLQAPPPEIIRRMSPLTLQEQDVPSEGYFRAVSPTSVPFADTHAFAALQNNDKAVSVEELLQILANMKVGPLDETPRQRPFSVQNYNTSTCVQNQLQSSSSKSLPMSWHQLDKHPSVQGNISEDLKQSKGTPPRSSKSYDCLRRAVTNKDRQRRSSQKVERRGSKEDIRKMLLEWRLSRSKPFEEEVECSDGNHKLAETSDKKAVKISFDGSESTENIETESKLTRTHSLKRPRKDRAFSRWDRSENETNNSVGKGRQLNLCSFAKPEVEKRQENLGQDCCVRPQGEENTLDRTSGSFNLEEQNMVIKSLVDEVASPEGIDIFIDYSRKNGMQITSTPKPPPYPGKTVPCKDAVVGKMNSNKPLTENLNAEKPLSTIVTEEFANDVESQGDASSSSYSSDDDRFGEFGGSTDTVVFVDTEHSTGISLVPDLDCFDMELIGCNNQLPVDKTENESAEEEDNHLDILLGEVRRSLNLEFVDSDILDKAIEKFKQRVSPRSQYQALSSGLGMEACVALHQADELQGIIGEIKGELKLLHDENDMLREQVVNLANQQTNGESTENSCTESSERLENLCKFYKPKQEDEDELVEIDVCLTGFSVVPLGHLPSKKNETHLGKVTVKGADWSGVIEAARRAFVDHIQRIDPDNYLGLGVHSIQGVQTGVIVWSPDSLRRKSPRVELSQKSNPCVIQLKDGSHFSCDSLVYDTLLPKETIEKYVEQLLEHRYIVLCGEQGLGKSYLATKLAEHVVQRIACKASPAVAIFNVAQATRKELNKNLASLMQNDAPSFTESRPAVVVLDQLNCLASLADVFDLSLLEKNENCPYIIGVRDKSRKGPFSPKELSLSHYFRWLRVSLKDRQYSGLLGRFLRRQLSWSQLQNKAEGDDLLQLFDWLTKVWYHLNGILEEYCEPDTTIGPSVFFSCPMDFIAAEGWFVTVWNYNVVPHLHQALRSGRKIFDRCISWEDPTKWVAQRYPWNKDQSRVFHTLRKLRQIDVVLNRNYLGSDNVCFAECIQENEKILGAHSTVSKRVRTVVQQKVSKRDSQVKRKTDEQMAFLKSKGCRDSSDSETDSYLETSI